MYQGYIGWIAKSSQEVNRYELWRGVARMNKLSTKAQLRLEWIIFYETAGQRNATNTAKHFGIARSIFYFWLSRFDETYLKSLEDNKSIPKTRRSWSPDPIVLERMIRLRKQYIHWSKMKLAVVYKNTYAETISSWQFQRVIEEFKLYPPRKQKNGCKGNGAKKQWISLSIRQSAKNLYSIDTKVLHLFGKKHYIVCAVAHDEKVAYARAYTTHSSAAASDFLARLIYLLGASPEIILSDNGSEFMRHFDHACKARGITRYFSHPQTPKDNPEIERLIKTFIEEWLNDGHWSPNLHRFNQYITEWLITYNSIRPHETLNYLTPLQKAEATGLLSKRSSSSTNA
jgi:putative transposase